jgi:hypothetical protein
MKCIKLVRIEHGLLSDLTAELINLLKGQGHYMEPGGAVMMFSATSLAAAGVAGYCADVMHCITTLKKELGEHLVYTPLPHLFGTGCQDETAVRAAVEVSAWAAQVFGRERSYLKRGFEVANNILASSGMGGLQAEVRARHRLPTLDMHYRTWSSSGMICLPKACRPAGEAEEKELITTIIGEIRRGLAIDLDLTPTFERGVPVSVGGGSQGSVLVVGDLGTKHLQAALREAGFSTDMLQVASWRIMKANVDRLLASLKAAI